MIVVIVGGGVVERKRGSQTFPVGVDAAKGVLVVGGKGSLDQGIEEGNSTLRNSRGDRRQGRGRRINFISEGEDGRWEGRRRGRRERLALVRVFLDGEVLAVTRIITMEEVCGHQGDNDDDGGEKELENKETHVFVVVASVFVFFFFFFFFFGDEIKIED